MKRNRYEYDVERGMSQSARKMPELDASYIQIDEKTEAELIGFTYRFSSIINYFDLWKMAKNSTIKPVINTIGPKVIPMKPKPYCALSDIMITKPSINKAIPANIIM